MLNRKLIRQSGTIEWIPIVKTIQIHFNFLESLFLATAAVRLTGDWLTI